MAASSRPDACSTALHALAYDSCRRGILDLERPKLLSYLRWGIYVSNIFVFRMRRSRRQVLYDTHSQHGIDV